MSHSKRNTSRSVFTSYERDLAKAAWASNSARLNRDSFLPFGSCYLCLELARDPVSCSHGDIFCRECAVSNLLAQKKEIKRLAKTREKIEQDLRDEAARQDEEADKRAVRDFELIQVGLTPSSSSKPAVGDTTSSRIASESDSGSSSNKQPGKRKYILDEDMIENIARQDRAKARRLMEEETAKKRLPSFWTPSETPGSDSLQATTTLSKQVKYVPICPASSDDSQHPYNLKGLHTVKFMEEADEAKPESTRRICPSCMRTLGNASRPLMAEKCGHVLCRSCVTKFLTPAKAAIEAEPQACFVCDEAIASSEKEKLPAGPTREFSGLIQLRSEGTGFSARGANTVQKQGVAFQC